MERAERLKSCITYIMFEIEAYSVVIFHYFLGVKPAGPDLRGGHFTAGVGPSGRPSGRRAKLPEKGKKMGMGLGEGKREDGSEEVENGKEGDEENEQGEERKGRFGKT